MLHKVLELFHGLIVSHISPVSSSFVSVRVLHWCWEMFTHRNVFTLWLLLHFYGTGSVAKFTFVSESSNAYPILVKTDEIHYIGLG